MSNLLIKKISNDINKFDDDTKKIKQFVDEYFSMKNRKYTSKNFWNKLEFVNSMQLYNVDKKFEKTQDNRPFIYSMLGKDKRIKWDSEGLRYTDNISAYIIEFDSEKFEENMILFANTIIETLEKRLEDEIKHQQVNYQT